MASAENQELVGRFEEFYRTYYHEEIGELAQYYPNEQRSLYLDWTDLNRFDPDIADDFRNQPEQLQPYAEEALRLYDLPVDVSLGQAHVRIRNLPRPTPIRDIRSKHVNNLVEVRGIVRKATNVRPKIQEAAFECQRCGTLTRIPQSGGDFQEPHECGGCERQGPFQINFDQSEFIDAQKLRIQESPEGLRGGETPQSLDVHIEDDITGEVTAGDHVRVTGVLHLEQQGGDREKSTMFDIYMDGMSVEVEEEQFEDMDITDEDKQAIVELSNEPDIYERMVDSLAPSIYGHRQAKLAMTLQLFSGVTKHLPDGSRTRGDMHMLLIGDPGTGKCLHGDTDVLLADGREVPIRDLVESNLDDPTPIDDGVYDEIDTQVPSLADDGTVTHQRASKVWKREAPEVMYRIRTSSGRELEVTPSHPLFVQSDGGFAARKAENLTEEQFIATPKEVPLTADDTLEIEYRRSEANNAVGLELPDEWTPSLARLVGYIIAEGSVTLNEDYTGDIRVTNEDPEVIADVEEAFSRLGLNCTTSMSCDGKSARVVRCSSGECASFLANLEPAILEKSAEQRISEPIFQASRGTKREFLKAYIEGESHVSSTQREITVASMSRELLEGVRTLLLAFGVGSTLETRKNGSYRLHISGTDFVEYVRTVGFITERKSIAATRFEGTPQNSNTEIVPDIGQDLRRVREALALSQSDFEIPRSTYQHYERGDRNPSVTSLRSVIERFETRLEWLRETKSRIEQGCWDDVERVRRELGISQRTLAQGMAVTQTAISYYERNGVVPDGGRTADGKSVVLDRIEEALAANRDVQALRTLVESEVGCDRIESIAAVEPDYEWVYDLEIEGTHNYVSNGVISHNSALLQYIRNIAPRSVYTSGKGSSSAGLTAAAVRDDFGEGQQWTLEAGALVLADRGIAAVDELDKMDSNDRSAMHEALEQQSISISKAGINATLKSRCSLLGAANPKYGRFDQYEPIGEQIDLDPALISRFDLIFTVTDQPDPEEDKKLAQHILQTNYAGELNTQRTNLASPDVTREEVDSVTEEVAPDIDADLLRKYIAYAQQNCYPRMTDEAREAVQDFYVDLRSKGADEDAPVPVTARKLEALVRLAEASARVRLSDTVDREDAERAIEIVRSCLQDIGVDPETGEYDVDVIETGRSKTQRDRVKGIKEVIRELQEEYDGESGAPQEKVIERADEVGIEGSKAEHEIQKLRDKGEIYSPDRDHLRLV